jgi:hypothetical protein
MKQSKRIWLSFLIPLLPGSLAVLTRIRYVVDPNLIYDFEGNAYTPYESYNSPLELQIFDLSILVLFLLAFILPFLVFRRIKQNNQTENYF